MAFLIANNPTPRCSSMQLGFFNRYQLLIPFLLQATGGTIMSKTFHQRDQEEACGPHPSGEGKTKEGAGGRGERGRGGRFLTSAAFFKFLNK